MSEVDDAIDQIESHAALFREQQLRAEIERLRRELNLLRELHHSAEKEVNELRAALRPFAVPVECWAPTIYANDPNIPVVVFENGMRIDRGHFDAARRALEGK